MSNNKPLIVFEGIEGSGKTTLINFVANYLKKKKINFIRIREPGGNSNSEKIRISLLVFFTDITANISLRPI